ncbi:hypothetical protein [Staphylococcus epidermidis]|nr:hypothetical protein [Staphylococcus epidermidis]
MFDGYSGVRDIKGVGDGDVSYGLGIENDRVRGKELSIEGKVRRVCGW